MARRREGEVVARGDGRWMIRWSLGRDESSGRCRAKSKTIHGTRRDAERELRRIQRSRDTCEYVDPSKETLNVFLDRWLAASGSRVSPRTLEGYRWLLRRYVRPKLGSLRLVRIRPLDVQALVNELEKSLSPRTVRLAYTPLSSALKQAVKWGLLHRNPAAYVDLPRQERSEMLALTAEQVATLRAKLEGDRYAALFDLHARHWLPPRRGAGVALAGS